MALNTPPLSSQISIRDRLDSQFARSLLPMLIQTITVLLACLIVTLLITIENVARRMCSSERIRRPLIGLSLFSFSVEIRRQMSTWTISFNMIDLISELSTLPIALISMPMLTSTPKSWTSTVAFSTFPERSLPSLNMNGTVLRDQLLTVDRSLTVTLETVLAITEFQNH